MLEAGQEALGQRVPRKGIRPIKSEPRQADTRAGDKDLHFVDRPTSLRRPPTDGKHLSFERAFGGARRNFQVAENSATRPGAADRRVSTGAAWPRHNREFTSRQCE